MPQRHRQLSPQEQARAMQPRFDGGHRQSQRTEAGEFYEFATRRRVISFGDHGFGLLHDRVD